VAEDSSDAVAWIMGHVETLSVGIGPRVASSPEEDEAADFIAATLEGQAPTS
jgi:hypothetical protein